MVDDDARDERLAAWLEPEPLDDVTRRRLVSTAMRETRRSNAVRWIAAAAAIVVVLVGGLALLTARGGNDEREAATPALRPTNDRAASPKALSTIANVGDFGDLDQQANLDALRDALNAAPASSRGASQAESAAGAQTSFSATECRGVIGGGATLAQGTGMLAGQPAIVFLTQKSDGSRSFDALIVPTCVLRHLP